MEPYRRIGIGRGLLAEMMVRARERGYRQLVFDTFPSLHPGMTRLAIDDGFVVTNADFSEGYRAYRLRFAKNLTNPPDAELT